MKNVLVTGGTRGLALPAGTRMKLELKDQKGKKRKKTLTYEKANPVPWGPAFYPKGMAGAKDVFWGKTENGWGYIHLRRCKGNLPEQVDKALAVVGDAPGIILDFRGNSGGGFDHPALMGRFIPKGKTLAFKKRYQT